MKFFLIILIFLTIACNNNTDKSVANIPEAKNQLVNDPKVKGETKSHDEITKDCIQKDTITPMGTRIVLFLFSILVAYLIKTTIFSYFCTLNRFLKH